MKIKLSTHVDGTYTLNISQATTSQKNAVLKHLLFDYAWNEMLIGDVSDVSSSTLDIPPPPRPRCHTPPARSISPLENLNKKSPMSI